MELASRSADQGQLEERMTPIDLVPGGTVILDFKDTLPPFTIPKVGVILEETDHQFLLDAFELLLPATKCVCHLFCLRVPCASVTGIAYDCLQ